MVEGIKDEDDAFVVIGGDGEADLKVGMKGLSRPLPETDAAPEPLINKGKEEPPLCLLNVKDDELLNELQWFLIALSVRPGTSLLISVHLLPISCCSRLTIMLSSSVNGLLLIRGSKWLYQRSLHCLPERLPRRPSSAWLKAD